MVDESGATSAAETPSTSPQVRTRRWLRRLTVVAVIVVILLALLITFTPHLLSTGPGTSLLTGMINGRIDGSVGIDDVSLRWFGGQNLQGVTLRDPQGEVIARIVEIEAPDIELLPLALGSRQFGNINVRIEQAHIRQPAGEPTNVEQALNIGGAAPPVDEPAPPIADLSLQLGITAEKLVYESPGLEPVELTNVSATANVPTVRDIHLEVHGDVHRGAQAGRIDADFSLRDAVDDAGAWNVNAASIRGTAEVTNLPITMIDRLTEQDGRLIALLGDELTASIQTIGDVKNMAVAIVARSERLQVDAKLASDGDAIRPIEGTRAVLDITPQSFALLTGADADAPRLVEPFTVDLRLDDLTLPIAGEGLSMDQATIDAAVTTGDIILDTPQQGRVALRGVSLTAASEAIADLLAVRLSGVVEASGVSEPIAISASIRNLLRSDQPLSADVRATALPITLADAIAQQEGRLVRLLGDTLDADVRITRVDTDAERSIHFSGRVESPTLVGPIEGSYGDDNLIALRSPEPMHLTVTPAVFADWVAPGGPEAAAGDAAARLALVSAEPIAIDIRDFRLAYGEARPPHIDADRSRVMAKLHIPAAVFEDTATRERFAVTQGAVEVAAPTLRQALELLASLRIRPQGQGDAQQAAEPGVIESRTVVEHLVSDAGKIQPASARIASETTLTNVPSILIDSMMRQEGDLAAMLGPTTSATATVHYAPGAVGDAVVQLDADGSTGRIVADITPQGLVRLREPAVFTMSVTPAMSRVLLKSVNPLLVRTVGADRPITLTIDDDRFEMPLSAFDVNAVTASAALDLGTLHIDNGGLLSLVLKALKRDRPGQLVASFTPLHVRLDEGQLRYDNMTMTLDNVVLDFAGLVNLKQDAVNLTLSVPGSALRKIFQDLEKVIPPDYVLTVPMRGSIDDPQIDTAAMAAEIARLTLRKELGPEGEVIGDLLDAILGGSRRNKQQ